MRIFITGGTGLVGSRLIETLALQGHDITVLSRDVEKAKLKLGNKIEYCASLNTLQSLDEYDAIINLAGESIAGKRWTDQQKECLSKSRWKITEKLTQLIKVSENPPEVYISGSAIGYYGAQSDNIITEDSVPYDEFTYHLCRQWEDYALAAQSEQTRVCILRTSVVLSLNGGMLPKLLLPFRWGLGSVMGTGKQYFSWVHLEDMVNIIVFLLNHNDTKGVFNIASPNPVTNRQFSKVLAKQLNRPCFFRIPSFAISLLMGEASALILGSQRVVPQHLIKLGYKFRFETIDDALNDILRE
ncbi:TIGR01777 family oxidoreductase [Dysgonomonas sp. ZJ709]|uniref:TIGR01777 family oxidoreductase n=1 Tax=Dysgonomonas sp. ZJ709 TaxID=2709797 RepID=UPI0013EC471B|nr:TIGR01777 family oxidoreductase [Dysgonomonas sp. ZJ709]